MSVLLWRKGASSSSAFAKGYGGQGHSWLRYNRHKDYSPRSFSITVNCVSVDVSLQSEALDTVTRHDEIARWIEERGVSAPAIFILEFLKPLTGCLRELFVASEPVSALVVSSVWRERIRDLLSSSEDIEKLIHTLERGIEPQGRLHNRT